VVGSSQRTASLGEGLEPKLVKARHTGRHPCSPARVGPSCVVITGCALRGESWSVHPYRHLSELATNWRARTTHSTRISSPRGCEGGPKGVLSRWRPACRS
jgi:hypothetical protein